MIEKLKGTLDTISEKSVLMFVNGVGYSLMMPDPSSLKQHEEITLHTYLHWHQEKGPLLYGFITEVERTVFLLIIDCPKIGPSVALTILSNISAAQFIDAVTSHNEKTLSSISGIGDKKAEQIITHLKHKVSKLLTQGKIKIEEQQNLTQWHNITQVLTSLNYSRQEVTQALQYLTEKYSGKQHSLDQLIRASLAFLSSNK